MCDKKYYYKLGQNIRGLRRMWGETQLDLAIAVDVQTTTISNYEVGERIPERTVERDVLIRIAKHYKITEDELLNGDYSNVPKIETVKLTDVAAKRVFFERLLPMACSKEAMQDDNFKSAFNLHMELYHKILRGDDFLQEDIDKCKGMYELASDNKVVEARANILWWNILMGFAMNILNVRLIEKFEMSNIEEMDSKDILQYILPTFGDEEIDMEEEKELDEIKKVFYEENIVSTIVNIRLLKLDKEYSDLGDFYFAVTYLIGLSTSSLTSEMNMAMGIELLSTYALMGNKYAKNFFGKE